MNTKIKICGIRRFEDIEYVNEGRPEYIGFVFAKSRRQVDIETAKKLKKRLNPDIQAVGVFVNEAAEQAAWLVNEGIIDVVQLHGDENTEYIQILRSLMKRGKIIQAVRVQTAQDVKSAENSSADYLLFDKFSPEAYGGTGETFEWKLIDSVKKPFFLAGGINCENVKKAVALLHPYSIDVSSAVETEGVKDRNKIMDIIKSVRETGFEYHKQG
ncbi:MAG: phosphoribosylanthranilate isomerase [Lachnospiraceae bacterium]|nr:phosphoribosylanthranilate isomerase [Lachnospiraceae bacterium]